MEANAHAIFITTCYCNSIRNTNTPIGHNIAFLKNTLGIDIVNNEITPFINLPKVHPNIN